MPDVQYIAELAADRFRAVQHLQVVWHTLNMHQSNEKETRNIKYAMRAWVQRVRSLNQALEEASRG